MAEINNYPALVDVIWKIVQGTPEDRERVDFMFSEQRIAEELGITYKWDSDQRTTKIIEMYIALSERPSS